MRTHSDPAEPDDEIPITPLIDAVFLLLIFFLVATMIRQQDRDIDIDLPQSVSAERLVPSPENYVLGIDRGGDVYFEGEETTIQALHRTMRDIGIQDPGIQIRLDVDRDTPTHRVIEVLDLCRFNRLGNVGIRTFDEFYNQR